MLHGELPGTGHRTLPAVAAPRILRMNNRTYDEQMLTAAACPGRAIRRP